jgi:hypothetical protein
MTLPDNLFCCCAGFLMMAHRDDSAARLSLARRNQRDDGLSFNGPGQPRYRCTCSI